MDFFKRLSGRRVFSELHLILEEENPSAAIRRLHEYNLLSVIHPSIKLTKELDTLFNSLKKVLAWHDLLFLEESYMKWAIYFLALVRHCDRETTRDICERIELAPRYRDIFIKDRFEAEQCLSGLERNLPALNSTLYHKLARYKVELILYMMAVTDNENVMKSISNFFTRLRHIRPSVTGKDLLNLGLEPGPVYKKILQGVLDAKLDEQLKTRNDELAFVKEYVQ